MRAPVWEWRLGGREEEEEGPCRLGGRAAVGEGAVEKAWRLLGRVADEMGG